MRFLRLTLTIAALFVIASPSGLASPMPRSGESGAQTDVAGSKDHPMFSRMPGYYISEYEAQDFGSEEFYTEGDTVKAEGKYWKITYSIKEGSKKAGPLQIGRNYTNLMVQKGGKKRFEDLDASGGRSVGSMPIGGGRTLWLEVYVADAGDQYTLTVIEEAALKQDVEFTAGALADALKNNGSIALHNILFDTGKASIKPESANALSVIADVLKNDDSLKLEIQGHTDNVGPAAANLKLSQDRAAAVKAYLVQKFGVTAARLTTSGFGDAKPIADNATEEGRAQNRRVELVKK